MFQCLNGQGKSIWNISKSRVAVRPAELETEIIPRDCQLVKQLQLNEENSGQAPLVFSIHVIIGSTLKSSL